MTQPSSYMVKSYVVGSLMTNCYIVMDQKTGVCIIIDPGDEGNFIAEEVMRMNVRPEAIFLTHGHFDHVLGAFELQTIYDIPVYLHPKDEFLLKRNHTTAEHYLGRTVIEPDPRVSILTKEIVRKQSVHVDFIETPGHTPGSVSYILSDANSIFVGDTVFAEGLNGSVDHAYSSKKDLDLSARTILSYPVSYTIYPGHGTSCILGNEQIFRKGMEII